MSDLADSLRKALSPQMSEWGVESGEGGKQKKGMRGNWDWDVK